MQDGTLTTDEMLTSLALDAGVSYPSDAAFWQWRLWAVAELSVQLSVKHSGANTGKKNTARLCCGHEASKLAPNDGAALHILFAAVLK